MGDPLLISAKRKRKKNNSRETFSDVADLKGQKYFPFMAQGHENKF